MAASIPRGVSVWLMNLRIKFWCAANAAWPWRQMARLQGDAGDINGLQETAICSDLTYCKPAATPQFSLLQAPVMSVKG